jgi:hypothetical protein
MPGWEIDFRKGSILIVEEGVVAREPRSNLGLAQVLNHLPNRAGRH